MLVDVPMGFPRNTILIDSSAVDRGDSDVNAWDGPERTDRSNSSLFKAELGPKAGVRLESILSFASVSMPV
jgi:hypothetical protein